MLVPARPLEKSKQSMVNKRTDYMDRMVKLYKLHDFSNTLRIAIRED
jgi:hypothetical protein